MRHLQSTSSSGPAMRFGYAYNDLNQRVQVEREDFSYWRYRYDALGQVVDASKFDPGAVALPGFGFGFDYDSIGNRLSASRAGGAGVQHYEANLLNQYEQRTVPSVLEVVGSAASSAEVKVNEEPTLRQGEVFQALLPVDNTEGAVWHEVETLAVDTATEVYARETGRAYLPRSPEPYAHDADGNLIQDGHWSYAWDAENRLIRLQTLPEVVAAGAPEQRLEFAYDGQSRRILKRVWERESGDWALVRDLQFVYDGWNLIAEISNPPSGTPSSKSFVWGLDLTGTMQGAGGVGGLLYTQTGSESYLMAYDANGNVVAVIDGTSGAKVAECEYGPFGELIRSSGDSEIFSFKFSTKYHGAETGLYYYGYRFYNPATGRWLNRDPIEEEGGVNLYGFVENDPINDWDYLGLAVIGIDGTWANYPPEAIEGDPRLDDDTSNVSRFLSEAYQSGDENTPYLPGPGGTLNWGLSRLRAGVSGAGSHKITEDAYKETCALFCESGCKEKISLVGWSRGAVIAIGVADKLNREGCHCPDGKTTGPVPVQFVGLFDAVKMMGGTWPSSVPSNVKHFAHANKTQDHWMFPTQDYGGNSRSFGLIQPKTEYKIVRYQRAGKTRSKRVSYIRSESTHGEIGRSFSDTSAYNWVFSEYEKAIK